VYESACFLAAWASCMNAGFDFQDGGGHDDFPLIFVLHYI
jgi:hypothetical protein